MTEPPKYQDSSVEPAPGEPLPARPRIGVSSCLLGHPVRYDGGHKRHRTVTETLSRQFEILPVCPEMEVGMGSPREPVDLVGDPRDPHMVAKDSGKDWTAAMDRYGGRRAAELHRLGLSGFVLKSASPSCGPDRVPVHGDSGEPPGAASGLFARALTEALPLLPVETETRLDDPPRTGNFVERVHAYREWVACAHPRLSLAALMDFHADHKLTLLAHSERHLRLLGRLLAEARNDSLEAVAARYGSAFMEALRHPATRQTNTHALQHLAGFISGRLDSASRGRLAALVDDYRLGRVSLSAPLALIRRHAVEQRVEYVLRQSFLRAPPMPEP